MPITQHYDRLLFGATVVLGAVGLAVMGSASWVLTAERYHRAPSYFLLWQGIAALLGMILMLAAMHLKRSLIFRIDVVTTSLALSWVLIAAAYLQPEINHTHRWLNIGGLSIQPSALARLATLLFVAVYLEKHQEEEHPWKNLLIAGGAVIISSLAILFEPDLGSAVVLIATSGMVFIVSGVSWKILRISIMISIVLGIIMVLNSPYRLARIQAFLEGGGNATAYQPEQALIAIGSGGLTGKGYAAGHQKLFFLPEPHTDFVFASTAEELGFIGMFSLIGLVSLISWRGFRVALAQSFPAPALAAFGITMTFWLQAAIHMAVCLRMLPPKGIPFPLVSYGKTDLVVTLISLGLLLNFSRTVRK